MNLINWMFGHPLSSSEDKDQKIGVLAGLPALGLDGLSSAAYGPEAALSLLIPLGAAGLVYVWPITGIIVVLLLILYFSYRQTITAYPTGGGSYTVASRNLGTGFGLLAAAALMLDYTLNVAVGISAGVEAIISALPGLESHTLTLCLVWLALITIVNLRGARESGALFALPTYAYVGTLLWMIVVGLVHTLHGAGHPHAIVAPPPVPPATEAVGVWMLLRAFASGCTAMTGVEAVSNGVTMFAEPTVKNAQRTLTIIVATLAVLLAGIAYLAKAYGIAAMSETDPNYQSVISLLLQACVGRGFFYYLTQVSVLIVLVLSANTSYTGFPRLCRLVAMDAYLPHAFALIGRRLVYGVGIGFLTLLAGALLIAFNGITDRLIPLFAVGAFLAFTLSQAGMVVHWLRRPATAATRGALVINAVGAVSTGIALVVILIAKFAEGAWITVLIIPGLVMLFRTIKRHYAADARAAERTYPLDVSRNDPPVAVVPIDYWNIMSERALRFAIRMTPDVFAVHVEGPNAVGDDETGERTTRELQHRWANVVVDVTQKAGGKVPHLEVLESPYRRVFQPLCDYVCQVADKFPDRMIAVILPELVETHWFAWLLHNHRATALKVQFLLLRDKRVVVTNIPWYPPA
jgi:amino acid transporter